MGVTLVTATVGLYSLAATLAWGWLLFHNPVRIAHPLLSAGHRAPVDTVDEPDVTSPQHIGD